MKGIGPKTKRVVLCGLGTVGKAFIRLLRERNEQIARKYGLRIEIAAVVDVGGAAISDQGSLPLEALLAHVDSGGSVETLSRYGHPGMSGIEAVSKFVADVLVETTPTNLVDGEPAKGHMFAALNKGLDVVSANKGPLVLFYREIWNLAKSKGCRVFMSAATAAALPTLDVGLICLAGAEVRAIDGVLNGTSNYILTRMHLEKCSYETALKAAQEMGIAETDPSLDVDGLDTRNKIVIIANRVFDQHIRAEDVSVKGIAGIPLEDIDKAVAAGNVIKLIGSAVRGKKGLEISVKPEVLEMTHPLAAVNYAEKGISYLTDSMGRVTVTGGKSSPTGAAAALLKDLIHTVMLSG